MRELTLGGITIRESNLAVEPRMTLAANVPVTPEFRASMNLWMREFFGVKPCMYMLNPQAIGMAGSKMVICHPSLTAKVKEALNA